MKAKTILAAVLTAICWISLCLDWDICMYLSGLIALLLVGLDDLKANFCLFTKLTSQRWLKRLYKSGTSRSIRKEVVKV